MSKEARLGGLLLGASLLAGFGCTQGRVDQGQTDSVDLEFYSWWREPSEQKAWDDGIEPIHQTLHPGVTVDRKGQFADTGAPATRDAVSQRILAGRPPDIFHANIGADLVNWAVVEIADAQFPRHSRIQGLGEFFERDFDGKLIDAIHPSLLAQLRVGTDSEPYAVPINIHRLNVIYYNEQSFREFGSNLLDIDTLCSADLNPDPLAGIEIAMATSDGFELFLLVFENLLPALRGAEFYERLFEGDPPDDWTVGVEEALVCFQHLSKKFNLSLPAGRLLNWRQAAARVATGEADFTVMGDWVNGELHAALGNTVMASPFPSRESVFVFTSDTFPLPLGAPHPEHTEQLLETLASREAQTLFSAEKGSIPARTDAELSPRVFNAEKTKQDFIDGPTVVATSGLLPPYFPYNALVGQLTAMTQNADADEATLAADRASVLGLLGDSMLVLRHWQANRAQGPAPAPP